jgi:NTE family protein
MYNSSGEETKCSHRYTNLVLEGGGVLGVAYCGALEELESQGILIDIINFAGASAGAIIAGVLACGGTSKTVTKIMKKLNFRDFLDYGNGIVAAYNILRYKGACPGDYFTEWYSEIIGVMTGKADITLAEIHERFGGRLVISVVNVTKRRLEFWDYKTKPTTPLVLAVRASMSIQGIFMPVEIDGDLYVDGGTLCNFPIKAFHYDGPNGDIINPNTIGLMLMSDEEISAVYPPVNTLIDYALACIECLWTQPQKLYMDEQDWMRTVKIPTGDISSINFGITADEVRSLISAGRTAVAKHLKGLKTFNSEFHCVRASHTPDDEVAKPKRSVFDTALLASRKVRSVQRGTNLNAVKVSHRSEDNWDDILNGIIDIDTAQIPTSTEKIKKTIGASPPIDIQFRLE